MEAYRARADSRDPDMIGRAVESAGGDAVRYLGALALPSDEVVFQLFDASSREALVDALAASAVRADRISEVDDYGLTGVVHGSRRTP